MSKISEFSRSVSKKPSKDTNLDRKFWMRWEKIQPTFWGRCGKKPELLMSLAWSNLNLAVPNLPAAEMYAQKALEPVPHRHDVRDILIPQINAVKEKRS